MPPGIKRRQLPATLKPFQWRRGQSGNPSGMHAPMFTLATIIRRTSGQGAELAAFYFSVLRGEAIRLPGVSRTQRPNLDQRLMAAAWLADRGWGRARELIQLAGEASAEERLAVLRRLTDDERDTLRAILTRALEDAPGAPAPEDAGRTGIGQAEGAGDTAAPG